MSLSKKHNEFIQQIAQGIQQERAYCTTIGNKTTTGNTARSQGSKLCKRYAKEIAEAKEKLKKVVEQANEESIAQIAKLDIMKSADRMAYLTKIIKGEIKVPYSEVKWNPVSKAFETIQFEDLATHNARIMAIAELNKMDGSYAPSKIETKVESDNLNTEQLTYSEAMDIKYGKGNWN